MAANRAASAFSSSVMDSIFSEAENWFTQEDFLLPVSGWLARFGFNLKFKFTATGRASTT